MTKKDCFSIAMMPRSYQVDQKFGFFHNILQKKPNERFGQPDVKHLLCTEHFFENSQFIGQDVN